MKAESPEPYRGEPTAAQPNCQIRVTNKHSSPGRNGLEIEKDVYIRVDKVVKNLSVSHQFKSDQIWQDLVWNVTDTIVFQHDHKRSVFVGNLSFGESLHRQQC